MVNKLQDNPQPGIFITPNDDYLWEVDPGLFIQKRIQNVIFSRKQNIKKILLPRKRIQMLYLARLAIRL